MEFLNVIKLRRSHRQFSSKPISKNLVNEVIDCARLAPSAKNRQNWLFIVLDNNKKDMIANIMLNNYEKTSTFSNEFTNSIVNSIRIIKEAPILILVFRDYDNEWTEADYLSIGASIENLCLRATDLGLGTLWIRDVIYTKKEITEFITNDNKELVSAIALGYSTKFPNERKKKSLKDIMLWK